jgi:hypothetical protein
VRYVDMREKLATSSVPRTLLFGPDARHWSDYGACLAMDDVASLYAELTGKPRPAHAAELEMVPGGKWGEDFDLWRLLNALFVPRAVQTTPAMRHSPPSPLAPCPSVLFVGTSFSRADPRGGVGGLYGMVHLNSQLALEVWPYSSPFPSTTVRPLAGHHPRQGPVRPELFEVFFDANEYVDQFLRDFLWPISKARARICTPGCSLLAPSGAHRGSVPGWATFPRIRVTLFPRFEGPMRNPEARPPT